MSSTGQVNCHLTQDAGEIYLAYTTLEPGILAGIMDSVKWVYYLLYGLRSQKWRGNPRRTLREVDKEDRLVLFAVETGSSISFKVKTGWVPHINAVGSDVEVELPRGAISIVAAFALLITGIEKSISTYSGALDIIQKQNAIDMQSIQQSKIELEVARLKKELDEAPESVKEQVQRSVERFSRLTTENRDICGIRMRTHEQRMELEMQGKQWIFRED